MADTAEPCPVCLGEEVRALYEIEDLALRTPGRWPFAVCAACGHGMIWPRPGDEELRVLYEQLYTADKLDLMEKVGDSGFDRLLRRRRIRALGVALGGQKPARLLDVGCGVGRFLEELGGAVGGERLGVEMGPPAAARARARGAVVHEAPFDEVQLQGGSVDVLAMNHFLEHHPYPRTALRRAAELLRPGGLIEIEVPRLDGWGRRLLGRWWWPHLPPQHVHLFTADGLARLLSDTGFDVVRRYTSGYPLTACAGWVHLVRRLMGRDSGRGPVLRALAWPIGLIGLTIPLAVDLLASPFLDRFGAGDILTVVARRRAA